MTKSSKTDIERAAKWNREHPEQRREIVNKSNRKRMDKIVAWNRDNPENRNRITKQNQKRARERIMNFLGHSCRRLSYEGTWLNHSGRATIRNIS